MNIRQRTVAKLPRGYSISLLPLRPGDALPAFLAGSEGDAELLLFEPPAFKPKMIARDFDGKVESRLHHKDIHIVLDLARTFGIALPASAAAADVLDRLQQRGGARQDSAAVFSVLESS